MSIPDSGRWVSVMTPEEKAQKQKYFEEQPSPEELQQRHLAQIKKFAEDIDETKRKIEEFRGRRVNINHDEFRNPIDPNQPKGPPPLSPLEKARAEIVDLKSRLKEALELARSAVDSCGVTHFVVSNTAMREHLTHLVRTLNTELTEPSPEGAQPDDDSDNALKGSW